MLAGELRPHDRFKVDGDPKVRVCETNNEMASTCAAKGIRWSYEGGPDAWWFIGERVPVVLVGKEA